MNNVHGSLSGLAVVHVASHCKNDGVIFTPFRSNDHSDACVLLSFKICEGSLVCVWLPFWPKGVLGLIQLY